MDIERRVPSVDEYLTLREAVGWKVPTDEAAVLALTSTSVGAVAVDDGVAVGMGRVVGDLAFYSFVVDLVVAPAVQGQGFGRRLLRDLEDQVADRSTTGHIALVADDSAAGFYVTLGYERATSNLMQRSLERERHRSTR